MVNQWLAGDGPKIGMLLKMICKFNDLLRAKLGAMACLIIPLPKELP